VRECAHLSCAPVGSGTGSKPDGPSGRHRVRRLTASQVPRRDPCTSTASSAYAEHDGKNRQGDGRPSRARWYQRIDFVNTRWGSGGRSTTVATAADGVAIFVTTTRPDLMPSTSMSPAWLRVVRTSVRLTRGGRRSRRDQRGGRGATEHSWHDDGDGCGRPRCRHRGRWKRPPAWWTCAGRTHTSTTADPSGRGRRLVAVGRRLPGHGCGQSSRQTGAALVATGLQHRAAATSAHPSAKAVLTVASTIVWLKCALHGSVSGVVQDPRKTDLGHW